MTEEQIKREARRLGVSPDALREVLQRPFEEAQERERQRQAKADADQQKRESRRRRSLTPERRVRAAVRRAFKRYPMVYEQERKEGQ
jgi:hypothetical protein